MKYIRVAACKTTNAVPHATPQICAQRHTLYDGFFHNAQSQKSRGMGLKNRKYGFMPVNWGIVVEMFTIMSPAVIIR